MLYHNTRSTSRSAGQSPATSFDVPPALADPHVLPGRRAGRRVDEETVDFRATQHRRTEVTRHNHREVPGLDELVQRVPGRYLLTEQQVSDRVHPVVHGLRREVRIVGKVTFLRVEHSR